MAKQKKPRRKAYRPKPVLSLPTILITQDLADDSVKVRERHIRDALLRLHFRTLSAEDYDYLGRQLVIGYRLASECLEEELIVHRMTEALAALFRIEYFRASSSDEAEDELPEVESALETCIEILKKMRIADLMMAEAYCEAQLTDILTNIRRLTAKEC